MPISRGGSRRPRPASPRRRSCGRDDRAADVMAQRRARSRRTRRAPTGTAYSSALKNEHWNYERLKQPVSGA